MINFNFLAQFGGELCEKQTQKIQKIRKSNKKKITFLGLWDCKGEEERGAGKLKSRYHQTAHLEHLLNVHTVFQLYSLIW